jgi:hypothetical protein
VCGGIGPRIYNLVSVSWLVVSFTLWPLYPRERALYTLWIRESLSGRSSKENIHYRTLETGSRVTLPNELSRLVAKNIKTFESSFNHRFIRSEVQA